MTDNESGSGMENPTKRTRRRHSEIFNLILINQVMSSDLDLSPSARKDAAKKRRKLQHTTTGSVLFR